MALHYDGEYDIICAGSGIGGLSAAVTAAENGAKVLVLEKFDKFGGVTALSSGQLYPGPTSVSEELGIPDSSDAAQTYLDAVAGGLAKDSLKGNYFAGSRRAIDFFVKKIGIQLTVIRDLPDYYYPKIRGSAAEGRYLEIRPFSAKILGDWADKVIVSDWGPYYSYVVGNEFVASKKGDTGFVESVTRRIQEDERCGGAGLCAALVNAALQRNVEFRSSIAVTDLITQADDVIGVVAEKNSSNGDGQKRFRFRARQGVLLATSSYDWNKELTQSFDGLKKKDTGTMVLPTVTGDHITMASRLGAIPVSARLPAQTPTFVGYRVPGEVIFGHDSTRHLITGSPHSMVVNQSGRRFANDGWYPELVAATTRFDGVPEGMVNWPAWFIFDQNMLDKYGLVPLLPGEQLPDGMASKSNSIQGLAELTGINAAGLCETVSRLNGFCKTGIDSDFGRGTVPWAAIMAGDASLPNPNLAEISKPPFYAVKLQYVTLGAQTAGLPIDIDGRVLTTTGTPIRGLYATGNATAWQDWGGGYNSGVAGMRGMLYGHRAALFMAHHDREARL